MESCAVLTDAARRNDYADARCDALMRFDRYAANVFITSRYFLHFRSTNI